jgi:hypothetical protein
MPETAGRDLPLRLALTLAAVAVFFAGRHIPLPGLDPHILGQLLQAGQSPSANLSVFALGVMPFVSALIILEIVKLAVPGITRWQHATPRNAMRFRSIAVGLALLFAAAQGLGLAVAFEDIPRLVGEPGPLFRIGCITTLVAATALLLALAEFIDRRGIGYGLWILFLAAPLAALPMQLAQLAEAVASGRFAGIGIVLGAGLTVATVAAVTAMMLAWGSTASTSGAIIWPTLIAYTAYPWVLMLLGMLLTGGNPAMAQALLTTLGPVLGVTVAILAVASVYLYLRSLRHGGVGYAVDPAILMFLLAATGLSAELIDAAYFGALPLSVAQLAVATVVATGILRDFRMLPPATAASN